MICGVAVNPGDFSGFTTGSNPESGSFDAFSRNSCTIAVAIRQAGQTQAFLRLNSDGTVSAFVGNATFGENGVLLGTSSATLTANAFNFLEVKITVHNTAGVFIVRLNGNPTPIINLSGVDTQATGTAAWDSFRLGRTSTNASVNRVCLYDDLYVLDGSGSGPWNDFLGDCRVDTRVPTGAGATTQWTPSGGANYAAVDEIPPNGDTDYVSALTAPATDTYVVQDAAVPAIIYGVQQCLNAKKTDAGACSLAPVVRVGGVDYVGADFFPATGYGYGYQILAQNPATAAQWVLSEFNAAEFGVKRTL